MKRILILTILLMSSLAWAGSTTVVVGQVSSGSGGGGACSTSTDSVQFAFADTEEGRSAGACTTTTYRGQYFILSGATVLTGVSLLCNRDVNPTGNTTIYLYAYDTEGDAPSGSALASCTVANSSLSATATETFFEFSSPYSASASTYCVYAVTEDAFVISRTNTNPVANSTSILSTDSGSSWSEGASYDYLGEGIYGCN